MTRIQRMEPVQRVMDDGEQQQAKHLGAAQRRLVDAEAKLAELQRYHAEYQQSFSRQASAGSSGMALRDFQVFLARLAEAVKQQEHFVTRATEDLAAQTRDWQQAAQRAKGLGLVVARWRVEERVMQERREQQETDARALRMTRVGVL